MASMQLCGVSKVYRDGVTAIDKLDLEVRDGELLVLMGPSGSGKTTTLRLISGLETPTQGVIRLAGRDLQGVPPRRRDIAMVFQGLALYGHLTAAENLVFGLQRRGEGQAIHEAVRWAAELLGIESLLAKRPAELSGGEQQRVAIGRALVRHPAVFLLDEPLANLDPPTRLGLRQELKRLQRKLGTTMVYVTHDQAEALALGDRIAVLQRGSLQQVGTPEEVYNRPASRTVASLFGGLGMNFLEVEVHSEAGGMVAMCGNWRLPVPTNVASRIQRSTAIVVGIRPEEVTVDENGTSEGLPAAVEAIEFQGDANYVQLIVRGLEVEQRLTSKLAAGQTPAVGINMMATINYDKVCWFDAESGVNLGGQATV